MCCGIDRANVIVRNVNDPIDSYQETGDGSPYVSKLETLEMEQADPKAQNTVGTNRVMDLLKELETARKEQEYDPIAEVKSGNQKDISDKENSVSPIGSK